MKQTGTCPKCQGQRVMHVHAVADAGDWVGTGTGNLSTRSATHPVPRRVLLHRRAEKGVFGGASESHDLTGEVEAYVCADCGYFEEYLKNPEQIPWAEIAHATPWKPRQGGPFR